jgi:CHAT domain
MSLQESEKSVTPIPPDYFQFESLQSNSDIELADEIQSLRRTPIPAANFRRLVEQNDCHSLLTTDQQYLSSLIDQKRRTIVQEFLESASRPSFWVCNIKQPYTTLKYSTNLRYVQQDVDAGTYDVIWSFAYIYHAGQWTKFHHKQFVLIAGKPVNESNFMGRTTNPDQEYLGNINTVIYTEGRVSTGFKIPIVVGEEWRFPVKEGYLGQSFKVVGKNLEVLEKGSVAFFIRKIAGGEGDGQVYFLGCELVQTKGDSEKEEQNLDDDQTSDAQQDLTGIDQCITNFKARLSVGTEEIQLSTRQLLGKAYFDRYRTSGDDHFSYCQDSIAQYKVAIEYCGNNPHLVSDSSRKLILLELGDVFMERLIRRRFDRQESANEAEKCFRSVLELQPNNFTVVAKLVFILNTQYELSHSQIPLDEALQLSEEALVKVHEEDESFQFLLEACASTLVNRSEFLGSADKLDTAVEFLSVGLELKDGVKEPWRLQQLLAEVLRRRFEVTGNRKDLLGSRSAIEATDSAENLLPRERIKLYRTRGDILFTQYLFNRDQELLRHIRVLYHEAIKLWTLNKDNPEFSYILIGLGYAVHETYSKVGLMSEFIGYSIIQSGCIHGASTISNRTIDPTMIKYAFEYGKAAAGRYLLDETENELEKARLYIAHSFELSFTHSDSNFSSYACAMSWVLRQKYYLSSDIKHIELAWRYLAKLLRRPWPISASAKARLAEEFGYHMLISFERTGDVFYLDQTINIRRKAVYFASTNFSNHVAHILDLARALLEKAKLTQRLQDFNLVNNELNLARRLVDQKKDRPFAIREVRALLREEQWKCSNDNLFLEQAIQLYVQIYTKSYSKPEQKIFAATRAAWLKEGKEDRKGASESFQAAEKLLIEFIISDGYHRNEQLRLIRKWSNVPINVAFYRLLAGDSVRKIVQSLEMSRSIIWNRTLNRRIETNTLKEKHPKLFEQFHQLKLQMNPEIPEKQQLAAKDLGTFEGMEDLTSLYASENSSRLKLAQKYAEVLELIRKQTGFESFLRPLPDEDRIQRLSNQGPIVMIIHSGGDKGLCYALIITETETASIYLPDFADQECATQFKKLKDSLALQSLDPKKSSQTLEEVLKWVWTAAAEPVLEHLGFTTSSTEAILSKGECRPRIWWVSSGWVNVFPIHAAGDHARALADGEKCSVIDRVISSYTPTISALEYTRLCMTKMTTSQINNPAIPLESPVALLVAMPETEGLSKLPNTRAEVEAVGHTLSPYFSITKLEGGQATKPTVVQALRHCSIAHFACHGKIDDTNPIESRLCLRDHRRKGRPLTVEVLMAMDMDNCQLAYLSACKSAVNKDMRLREEGLHLSGALQMAGVPNTVATWWEISDVVSVTVAANFYENLVRKNSLDINKAAEALHTVTLGLRNKLDVLLWGAYVHFGP